MKATLLKYIREHPTATFANFHRDIPGFDGDWAMTWPDFPKLILWPGISDEAYDALKELMDDGLVAMKTASFLSYFHDGTTLSIPLAGGIKHYKNDRWVPVCFSVKRRRKANVA